jgi:hypothetical protein
MGEAQEGRDSSRSGETVRSDVQLNIVNGRPAYPARGFVQGKYRNARRWRLPPRRARATPSPMTAAAPDPARLAADRFRLDGPYARRRLALSLVVGTIGNVGMWVVIMVLPAVQAEFGGARADASLPYT